MLSRSNVEWLAFAIVSAIAAHFVAPSSTPIDRALPFVIVLLSICGFMAQRWPEAMQIAIVLLLLPPIFLTAEHARLLAYGVIAAAVFALAVAVAPRMTGAYVTLTVAGVALLRWIPFSEVIVWREAVVLVGALVVLLVYRDRTPMAIVVALAIALITPIFPARVMFFPLVVSIPVIRIPLAIAFAAAAYFARYSIAVLCAVAAIALALSFLRRGRFAVYACGIALMAMWPWSGIVARAFPKFLIASPPPETNRPVWVALERRQSVSIDAPDRKHAVGITASAANAARFRKGTLMGTVEVVGRTGRIVRKEIRIGDIADFGFM
ncbi:MAG TPA: hypothetical protein VKL19_17160, partial [Thermoanaerobaculia bacterium]|nr:hypothetical protein [Thermoanaerobaculia bacterium]